MYEGWWQWDRYHGYGKLVSAGNSFYIGEWKNGEKTGKGYYERMDGVYYSGYFYNDVFNGLGMIFYSFGEGSLLNAFSLIIIV